MVLYSAPGCHLCELARETLMRVRGDVPFELREIDISDDEELERRYRVLLPVVEIDGVETFVCEVDESALRRRLAAQTAASDASL